MTVRTEHRVARGALALCTVVAMSSCGGRSNNTTSTTAASVAATSTVAGVSTVAVTTAPQATTPATTAPATSAPGTTAASTTPTTPTTTVGVATTSAGTADQAAAIAQITANWERFFLPTTSVADRVTLLENGPSLQAAIEQRSTDPLMQQASAKVKGVEFTDSTHATVTYDVMLNGTVALADSQGTAVLQAGVWKVGAQSFCALISLGATAPIPGCS